jgi:hypothetical protein
MPAPSTGRELHIDGPLSNVVVGRRPAGFIADQLLPVTSVSKQSDLYYKYKHLEWYRAVQQGVTLRAPGTEAKKVYMTVSSDGYYAKNYALGTDWPVEDAVNADQVLQWTENAANFLMDKLMLDYEGRVANLCAASTSVATIFVAASSWVGKTVPIFSNIMDWKENFRQITGQLPNTIIIPEGLMRYVRRNDELRGLVYGSVNGGLVQAEQLASLCGVERILVPTIQVNTAAEIDPQGGSFADIWAGNGNFWMAKINNLSGMMTDTWLNSFRWTSPEFGTPMAVQRYPFDAKKKVYGIEVSYYQDEKVISSDLAVRVSSLAI